MVTLIAAGSLAEVSLPTLPAEIAAPEALHAPVTAATTFDAILATP
jgi:hypothetical protein